MTALTPVAPLSTVTGPTPSLAVFSPRKMAQFCENLALHGNVRLACRSVRVSPQTAYRARRASPDFALCWDTAIGLARHAIEEVLADRALNGIEEEVFFQGEAVATRRRYDTRLLLAHLARIDRLAQGVGSVLPPDQFDHAIAALEKGRSNGASASPDSAWPDSDSGAFDPMADPDVPPVEACLRWLEQRGFLDE